MKTKRLIALTLALLLTLTASGALAESIFGTFQDEPEAELLLAPSYGGMANVEPDLVEESAEGGAIVTYLNVNAGGVNSFGEYLGKLGFSVTRQEEQAGKAAFAVTDGQVDFVMIYDQAAKTMQLIYPQGTEYKKAQFPGYTRIEMMNPLVIPGLGNFVFEGFFLNQRIVYCNNFFLHETSSRWEDTYHSKDTGYTWLKFSFFNESTSDKAYYGDDNPFSKTRNDLLNMELDYLVSGQTYTYPEKAYGTYWGNIVSQPVITIEPPGYKSRGWIYYEPVVAKALESLSCGTVFELPASIRNSTDGTLAIKLDFVTGEKYVLVVRENGVDLNIAPAQSGN